MKYVSYDLIYSFLFLIKVNKKETDIGDKSRSLIEAKGYKGIKVEIESNNIQDEC